MSPTNEEVLPVSLFIEFFPFYTANRRSLWKQNEIKSEWDISTGSWKRLLYLTCCLFGTAAINNENINIFYSIFITTIFTGLFMRCSRALFFLFFSLNFLIAFWMNINCTVFMKRNLIDLSDLPRAASLKWMVCVPTFIWRGFKHGMIHEEGEWWLDL